MNVEIRGLGDCTSFTYDPKTKQFEWSERAIRLTTETYRKEYEENFLKDLKSEKQ